ncbi:MAG: 2-dehydro-3-deoxyphosphooctonate aldolase (KDO 8-P synthase) [Rickettsiales bacterium]|jgi:2-dehydro-3-deoxyphosphooctonate aldolase (KDO 8-P synthase)
MRTIEIRNLKIANNLPFTLIAGPCQTEDRDHSMMMAENIKKITDKLEIGFIYKSSFDKANRSSADSQRGLGLTKTLKIFEEIKNTFDCPILTDVHSEKNCNEVGDVVDIIQIPAFLCRQTDLLKAAADTGKIINIKKGQFLAPWDAANIVKKMDHFGNEKVMLTERGASFGYNTLVSDMRSLPIMARTGCPVIFDATHSVQQPGGQGGTSGGQREFVETLASAAIAVGVAAIFAETHQDPDNAPSDGPCMLRLDNLEKILTRLKRLDEVVKG